MADLIQENCCKCNIPFGIEAGHRRQLLERGGTFHCPNGHAQHYTDTKVKRLERDNLRLEESKDFYERMYRDQIKQTDHARRSAASYKGQVTKAKKKALQQLGALKVIKGGRQ